MDFEQKFEFFKTHKNSYTGPLRITDLEYGGHDQVIQKFRSVFAANYRFFAKTIGVNLRILSENVKILKTCKNSCMRPLCITNLEYEGHNQEIWSFG
jgi:hypothetical protein